MTSTQVRTYSDKAAKLPDGYFLGQIVSFTITEADIRLDEIRERIEEFGLRDGTLKKKLRPIDAFKKAATDVATKFPRAVDAQHSFLVRAVGQDDVESHRHIVLERAVFKTGEKRRVEHHTVMKLIYDRGEEGRDGTRVNTAIEVEPVLNHGLVMTGEEKAWLDRMVGANGKKMRQRFDHYCTHLDSHAVRTFVREYLLNNLGAINVKSNGGGLYFVPQRHVAELRNLSSLVKEIGSAMHLIPLLDIIEQRDMLAEAFIADTNEEIRQLSVEMGKILQDKERTILEATYDAYTAKAASLIEKAKEYQSLLDTSLDKANFEVDVFQKKTLKLAQRVRRPASLSLGRK